MIMCVLLCYPVSFHMLQLLLTGCPISCFHVLASQVLQYCCILERYGAFSTCIHEICNVGILVDTIFMVMGPTSKITESLVVNCLFLAKIVLAEYVFFFSDVGQLFLLCDCVQ